MAFWHGRILPAKVVKRSGDTNLALLQFGHPLHAFDLGKLAGQPPPTAPTAADKAHALRPDDLFINTTLSRIWMEKGDKATAEKYGAQAKILSWKDQLRNPNASGAEIKD